MIWHASLDPGTLVVEALPADGGNPDAILPEQLQRWLALARDIGGHEHAVLSDGWHHIRIDLAAGSLASGPVVLRYRLEGALSARPKLLPLRRLIAFSLDRRFPRTLYPADPRVARWLTALRVQDALLEGASQREIGEALFGEDRVAGEWDGASDSLRSRARRLVREARQLARGGWRQLLRRR